MTSINSMIPLAANPAATSGPDMKNVLAAQAEALKLNQARQQQASLNALRQLFADPSNLDASGNPTPEAMNKIMSIDPGTGMQLRNNMVRNEEAKVQLDASKTELFAKKFGMIKDVSSEALTAYEESVKNGTPPQQAQAQAQKVYTDGLGRLRQSGLFSDQDMTKAPTNFNPVDARSRVMSYEQWQAQQEKEKADKRADTTLGLQVAAGRRAEKEFQEKESGLGLSGAALDEAAKRYKSEGTFPEGVSRKERAAIIDKASSMQGIVNPKQLSNPVEVMSTDDKGQKKQVLAQQDKETGQWVTADEKHEPVKVTGLSGKEQPVAGDPDVETAAKAIANYQMAPLTGFAMRSPYGQAVMARAIQINPDYEANQFTARSKAQKDFATGKQGDSVRSFNVGISHLNTLDGLVDALNNKDMKTFNRLANQVKEEFGSAAPTNFDAAKAIVGDEIIKAIVGGGGALADRENAQNQLDRAKTPAQLKGVIETYKDLMAGQLTGLKKQYETTTGLKNFDERLSDETKAQLESKRGREGGKSNKPLPSSLQSMSADLDYSASRQQYRNRVTGKIYDKDGSPVD